MLSEVVMRLCRTFASKPYIRLSALGTSLNQWQRSFALENLIEIIKIEIGQFKLMIRIINKSPVFHLLIY